MKRAVRSPRNATHVSTTRKCCNKKEIVVLFVLYVYANGPDPAAAPVAHHEILRFCAVPIPPCLLAGLGRGQDFVRPK